jgi:hypothetical protein
MVAFDREYTVTQAILPEFFQDLSCPGVIKCFCLASPSRQAPNLTATSPSITCSPALGPGIALAKITNKERDVKHCQEAPVN